MAALKKARVEESTRPPLMRPWTEKYRPRTLDDVVFQTDAVNALRACMRVGSGMPHLLFYGPPGTGKTSTVLAACRELYGPDYMGIRVRELNASDDRGIQVIREKVKVFAAAAVAAPANLTQSDGKVYPLPPFKVIILDEADALLPDAQAALRRMMEDFAEVTRFFILCNYVTRIIDAIASRCAKIRFKPLPGTLVIERLSVIATAEGVSVTEDAMQRAVEISGGDLRHAITFLQSAARRVEPPAPITADDVMEISGAVPPVEAAPWVDALLRSGSFEAVRKATMALVEGGHSATAALAQLLENVNSPAESLGSVERSLIAIAICDCESRVLGGADEYIQLLGLGAACARIVAVSRRAH